MITRGVKEWYLASLQDDEYSYHSFTPRVIIILSGPQVPFFYSTSDHHPVRTSGTILLLHEWSSFCNDASEHCFYEEILVENTIIFNTYCVVFLFSLSVSCWQFLWIFHFWFSLRYSLTFISIQYKLENMYVYSISFWCNLWISQQFE
jgi:hypothetical protein